MAAWQQQMNEINSIVSILEVALGRKEKKKVINYHNQ